MPEGLRVHLAKPFGILYREDSFWKARAFKGKRSVTVGDIVTSRYLSEAGVPPSVAFVDLRTLREESVPPPAINVFDESVAVRNPPGFLFLGELVKSLRKLLDARKERTLLVYVYGEEDLVPLSLPFLGLPPGTLIIYGQPGEGVVAYELNDVTVVKTGGLLACMRLAVGPLDEAASARL